MSPHRRYGALRSGAPRRSLVPGAALREALIQGYTVGHLRRDVLAGLVVGVVALPLSMALAIASGVPPQYGLYTAIVAGALAALLGGSRVLVTGPTAAFVVLLVPISTTYGLGGLVLATIMAGMVQLVLGVARTGRLLEYVPLPVVTGFTAGIAVVIAVGQVKDFLGLTVTPDAPHFLERASALMDALPTVQLADLSTGILTLGLLILWPVVTRKVPAPLVALVVAAVAALLLGRLMPEFDPATIGSRFSFMRDGVQVPGIPAVPPQPVLPWRLPGPDGRPLVVSLDLLRALTAPAFAIAFLGAMESLLAAVAADGMAGTKHEPNVELLAQGAANIVAPFFGGFAATGAIARTAASVRAGARSPVAALIHSVFVLAAILLFAPLLSYLPLASLAALLLLVAWNMSDIGHVRHVLRVAPRADAAVLLTCLALTVLFDMVTAVGAGVVLAALLFMRRMAEITGTTLVEGEHPALTEPLPEGVVLYEIAGPLFFGAAQKAMTALHQVSSDTKVVILDLEAVPVMDTTGLVNLDSTLGRLRKDGVFVILAGLRDQPAQLLARAGFIPEAGRLAAAPTVHEAVALAREAAPGIRPKRHSGAVVV